MANIEEALWFLESFYIVDVIFKRFEVNLCENARIAINPVLFEVQTFAGSLGRDLNMQFSI